MMGTVCCRGDNTCSDNPLLIFFLEDNWQPIVGCCSLTDKWVHGLQAQINDGLLRDGFPLPDIPHVQVLSPNLTFVPHAVRLDGDVAYVPG